MNHCPHCCPCPHCPSKQMQPAVPVIPFAPIQPLYPQPWQVPQCDPYPLRFDTFKITCSPAVTTITS